MQIFRYIAVSWVVIAAPVPYTPIRVDAMERTASRIKAADAMFPAVKPPFSGHDVVWTDPDSHVWVERSRAWSDSIPTYDVFDATGTRIGNAKLRPHSRIAGFGPRLVYIARQTPDDDLWHVEAYDSR